MNGGRAPLGFKYVGKAEGSKGQLVVAPEQAKIVRKVFRWADEGVKLLDIARRPTDDGVQAMTGAVWSKTVLSGMLRNSVYVGEARGNWRTAAEPVTRRKPARPGKSKKTSTRSRPAAEWILVHVPQTIDRAVFDRVQARLQRGRHINSDRPSPYILRGLIKCGVCAHACCVFPNHGWPHYRCNNIDRLSYRRNCL